MLQNPSYRKNLENWYSYFSDIMSAFFPSDINAMLYFIIWVLHGFPN